VVTDVRTAFSRYQTTASLRALLDSQDLIDPSIPNGVFFLHRCTPSDLVFHDRGTLLWIFFMYARVMKDLHFHSLQRLLYGRGTYPECHPLPNFTRTVGCTLGLLRFCAQPWPSLYCSPLSPSLPYLIGKKGGMATLSQSTQELFV